VDATTLYFTVKILASDLVVLKRLFVGHFGPGGVEILVGERHVSRSPPILQLTWHHACTVIIGFRGCFAGHKDEH
jgi:hypothetical protein